MRGLTSTLVLLAVAIGLGAYIYFVEMERPPAGDEPALDTVFDIDASEVEELRVRAESGEVSELRRGEEGWQLVAPVAAPADETAVRSITSLLASLEIQRIVEEEIEEQDMEMFGLAEPRIEVGFRTEGETGQRRLLIGEQTATGGDLYARVGDEPRVFLISGWLDGTVNRTPFDLRDKRILRFDRDASDALEIAAADGRRIELRRSDGQWRMVQPWATRADYAVVEGLISWLTSAQMRAILDPEADDLQPWGLDRPVLTATVVTGSARSTLEVGREADDGNVYARDTARPMVFAIDPSVVQELERAPEEYRRKDLFEFRAANATRFEATREGLTVTYERVASDADEAAGETRWQRLDAGEDVDRTRVESALSRFSNLRAQSFAESDAGTGLDSPILTIAVTSEEGARTEEARFGRAEGAIYASRPDEPGVARIDPTDFDLAVQALDEIP